MAGGEATGVDLSRKFVSESELDERRKKRQEEWEKVRKPDDPEGESGASRPAAARFNTFVSVCSPEAPEEEYDPRCLYDRLQEQKEKKQQEFEEQFKFRNMVRGLDEDETSFLDEVSRQQVLVEKQRRDEEKQELLEYRSALVKQASASAESRRESEKKAGPKQSGAEPKTSHLSQAHLLVGAVKRRSSSQSSDGGKKPRVENARGIGDRLAEEDGGSREAEDRRAVPGLTAKTPPSAAHGMLHLPSAAVCVGVLPGLSAYSGSSDSDSSSDSEV